MTPKSSLIALFALCSCLAGAIPVPDKSGGMTLRLHFDGKESGDAVSHAVAVDGNAAQGYPWKKPESPEYVGLWPVARRAHELTV